MRASTVRSSPLLHRALTKGTQNSLEGPGDYTTTRQVHSDTYPAIDPTKADLSGKAVFIAGASRGLGKAIAISFAKAGASYIAIGARSDLRGVEDELKAAATQAGRREPKILALKLDIADLESVEDAAKRIEAEFQRLDVVVNNAATIGLRGVIVESDPEEWWETMTVNVRGPYFITRSCVPLLLKGQLKTLINVASVGAHLVGPRLSHYQTSKLALVRLTEFTAKENAEQGLVAISIHPGNVLTDMVGRGEEFGPAFRALFTETPQLCADGLVYLCREKRDWLSGRYVNITWDLPELTSEGMKKKIVDGDMLKVRLVTPSYE